MEESGIRQGVKNFMRECERLLGFEHQNGGLTAEEYAEYIEQQKEEDDEDDEAEDDDEDEE